jgi:ethanolamine ammonia-lyase large subunit
MSHRHITGGQTWTFRDLKDLLAKASPPRADGGPDVPGGAAAGCVSS